jgi:hypothetical protein
MFHSGGTVVDHFVALTDRVSREDMFWGEHVMGMGNDAASTSAYQELVCC